MFVALFDNSFFLFYNLRFYGNHKNLLSTKNKLVSKPPRLLSQPIESTKPRNQNIINLSHSTENRSLDLIRLSKIEFMRGNPAGYLALTNRIDKSCSGVSILAKSSHVYKIMCEKYRKRQMRKGYLCIVDGLFPKDIQSTFKVNYERIQSEVRKATHESNIETEFHVDLIGHHHEHNEKVSSVFVHTNSGEKHVVRRCLANLGFPIKGDKEYGARASPPIASDVIALHAFGVAFKHPTSKPDDKEMIISAPIPESWTRQRWDQRLFPLLSSFIPLRAVKIQDIISDFSAKTLVQNHE